jgi:ribosomal protein S18 acetylase RimI-like enzyme
MLLIEHVANQSDLDFLYSSCLYGARKGHYAVNVENPEMLGSLKQELQSVIDQQRLLDGRRALASVFSLNKKRIAMLIISELIPDSDKFEIYALSVMKKYQQRGFGSQILQGLVSRLPQAQIVARCSPASDQMVFMLEKHGFKLDSIDQDYRVLARTVPDASDLVAPFYAGYSF